MSAAVRALGAIAASCLACAVLGSCVGVGAEARIEPDGSGSLDLSLSVSRMASPMASLEEERRMLPFPIEREGFARAAAEAKGVSLVSYYREEGEEEISVKAKIAFESPLALAAFLDPSGGRAVYSEAEGRRSLRLVLAEGGGPVDQDLARLADVAFSRYRVELSLALPRPPARASLSPGKLAGSSSVDGSRAAYSNSTAALMKSAEPVEWEIVW